MTRLRTSKLAIGPRLRTPSLLGLLAAGIAFAACSNGPPPPVPAKDGSTAAQSGGPPGRFVGSEACRSCHPGEYDAWSKSRHRSTLRPWTPGQPLRLATVAQTPPYRMLPDGSVSGPGTDGKDVSGHVAFLVGGHHREEAIVRLADGRFQVFPIAFDADRGVAFEPLRELAGGTPPPPEVVEFWTRVGRNADLACYGCHATGQTVAVAGKLPSGLVVPESRWVEPGVGCEGCHGPGGGHIDAAGAGKTEPTTVRMTHRESRGIVEACAACHGLRDVLPSPFNAAPAHRYGESIVVAADPLLSMGANSEFRDPLFADLRPATYQQEAIAFSQSGCARKGGLTCSACHDVHSGSPTAGLSAPDGGSALCTPCHQSVVARGEKHTLHRAGTPGGRCLDCHMAAIVRGPGRDAARDHSMAPPIAGAGQIPAACATCHAGSKNAAVVAAAWQRRPEGGAAKRRLEINAVIDAAVQALPGAATPLARLAKDPSFGWFVRWVALQRLAAAVPGPASEDVLDPVRSALGDENPALRRAAARVLGRLGKPPDIELLVRATDDPDPWTALEAMNGLGPLGAPKAQERFARLLKRPDLIADARAQFRFGHASLVAQDFQTAETALRRALALNPMIVPALNDLGLALMGLKKREEAIAAWRLALEINPRYSGARHNLELAKP